MLIDRDNYGILVIDYFDGRLSKDEVAELMHFLDAHPDLKAEIEGLDRQCLDPGHTCSYHHKLSLKHSIVNCGPVTEDSCTSFFFESVEGNLSHEHEKDLALFLMKNPALQRDYELMKMTVLEAPRIIYSGKEKLKKEAVIKPFTRRSLLAAAAVLLLIISASFAVWYLGGSVSGKAGGWAPTASTDVVIKPVGSGAGADGGNDERNFQADLPQMNPAVSQEDLLAQQERTSAPESMPFLGGPDQIAFIEQLPVPAFMDNEYTFIMQQIALRQQIMEQDSPDQPQNLTQMGMNAVYKANGTADQAQARRKFSLWDLAEIGVAGYNALSRKDVEMTRVTNANGKTEQFALGNLEYRRK